MSDQKMSEQMLIGVWDLIHYSLTLPDGTRVQPIGAKPLGRLIYTADHIMSAHLMPADGDGVTYLSYSGRWHIAGPEVLHDVDFSTRPGMVGTTQRRQMEFGGETLTLTANMAPWQGRTGQGRLTWRRAT